MKLIHVLSLLVSLGTTMVLANTNCGKPYAYPGYPFPWLVKLKATYSDGQTESNECYGVFFEENWLMTSSKCTNDSKVFNL